MNHVFEQTTLLNQPLKTVFDFFSDAGNLNRITPPELSFNILTPLPLTMKTGLQIDYSIRLHGIPFKWKTEITEWNPPFSFTDTQLKGPYVLWKHQHQFRAIDDTHTEMIDRVTFRSPGWILEPLIHHLFVKRKVEQIFEFRQKQLTQFFNAYE